MLRNKHSQDNLTLSSMLSFPNLKIQSMRAIRPNKIKTRYLIDPTFISSTHINLMIKLD